MFPWLGTQYFLCYVTYTDIHWALSIEVGLERHARRADCKPWPGTQHIPFRSIRSNLSSAYLIPAINHLTSFWPVKKLAEPADRPTLYVRWQGKVIRSVRAPTRCRCTSDSLLAMPLESFTAQTPTHCPRSWTNCKRIAHHG